MIAICNSEVGDDPVKLCRQFCGELADVTGINTPPKALAVVFQAVAVQEPPPQAPTFPTMPQNLVDPLKRINAMRTEQRRRRGLRLATAAMGKLGQWRWIQRAPDEVLPYYVDNSSSTTGYTDLRGYDQWVKRGGNPPSAQWRLNCREAVLVVAREAGPHPRPAPRGVPGCRDGGPAPAGHDPDGHAPDAPDDVVPDDCADGHRRLRSIQAASTSASPRTIGRSPSA
ncbi:MAG: hypothetical protein R3F60_33335 [bacterium]